MAKIKLTAAEKDRRKHERKAKSLNKAAEKSYGPLFAHLAPKVTAEDAYWRWRRSKVGESPTGEWAMQLMQLSCIRSYVEKVLGKEVTDKLVTALEKYPFDYRRGVWRAILDGTGKQVLRFEVRHDPARVNQYNRDGRYLVEAEVWPPAGYVPVMTAAEFDRRFPAWVRTPQLPEHDDGGLFEEVMAKLPSTEKGRES